MQIEHPLLNDKLHQLNQLHCNYIPDKDKDHKVLTKNPVPSSIWNVQKLDGFSKFMLSWQMLIQRTD